MSSPAITEKKVFFLYPPSVVQDQLLQLIIQAEFEVYTLKDHKRIIRFLRNHPNSVIYINLDSTLKEEEWETKIRDITADPDLGELTLGILTYNENKDLAAKYLMEIGCNGGFVTLKLGLKQSAKIILNTLQAVEARGQRRYVRASCEGVRAVFNVAHYGERKEGTVVDVSVAGAAVQFNTATDLPAKSTLYSLQLNLKGKLVTTNALVYGSREIMGRRVYILLFQEDLPHESKLKIRTFVHSTLQNRVNKDLDALPED